MDAVEETLEGDQKASASSEMVHAKDSGKEKDKENEERLSEGILVWAKKIKIKNHQWWPGLVYSSSDASDLALQTKQNGTLLVAYFGDVTFAWCHPSQVKPFEENFKQFSKLNISRSFSNAVENAVEEIGRRLESVLTCSCVPEDYCKKLSRPFADNEGVKTGVLVPNPAIFAWGFEPETILSLIRTSAEIVTSIDMLESELLKRKVSAFYKLERGYELPKYNAPLQIVGLEDSRESDERSPRGRGRPRKKVKSISEGDMGDLGSTPSPSKKKKLSEGIMETPLGRKVKNKDLGSDSDDDISLTSPKKKIKLDDSKSGKDSDKSNSQTPSPTTDSLSRERKQSSLPYTIGQFIKEMESNHTENFMASIRAMAVNPLCGNEEGSSVSLGDFTAAFRDFAYEKPNHDIGARESDTETNAEIQNPDALEALNSSRIQNPVDNSNSGRFNLRSQLLPCSSSDDTSIGSFICLPRTTNKPGNAQMSESSADPEFKYVKEKLEEMILMLEESDGKLSAKLKTELEIKMRNVLDKLSKTDGTDS